MATRKRMGLCLLVADSLTPYGYAMVMTDADKIADLERRVAHLEQIGPRYGPIEAKPATEPLPSFPVFPIMPSIGANPRCPKCNIELSPVMGYVCSQGGNCPTGLGGFTCSVGNGAITRNDVTVTVSNRTGTRPNPANGAPKPPGHNPVA